MAYVEVINELNLKDTELHLGLPRTEEQLNVSCVKSNKRRFQRNDEHNLKQESSPPPPPPPPPAKTQIVGWPPVRSNRKNNNNKNVSMDGALYLRKIDLKMYKNYHELLRALENMFKFTVGEYSEREGYKGSGFVHEDKDGDWMLVGDVPWDMFSFSCQKLRIMKRSEADPPAL